MKCIYYPGCSQKASSISYEKSFLKISRELGIEMIELDDWNCCGTTVAVSLNELLALTIAARNLAIAEPLKLPVVAICPSCYTAHAKVNNKYKEKNHIIHEVNEALNSVGLNYSGKVKVLNILDFLVNIVGLEKIQRKVKRNLSGLRIAPFYGCQMVNPYSVGDDNRFPQNLENIIRALGAVPVDFPARTACCGGSLMITKKTQAEEMSCNILKSIQLNKADVITTPCGLCQINLDFAKNVSKKYLCKKINIPVLNIGELIEHAFGLKDYGLNKTNVNEINELISA